MKLSAGIKEDERKDKDIEILLSTLKRHVYDLFKEEIGEQLQLFLEKVDFGVIYSLKEDEYTKEMQIFVDHCLKEFREDLIKLQEAEILEQYDRMVKQIDTRFKYQT